MESRLKNITEMENILNATDGLIADLENLLQKWEENLPDFQRLMKYYGSEQWHEDRFYDDAKQIPQDFPRGVLSEDGVHNTFGNKRELAIRMIKSGVADLE